MEKKKTAIKWIVGVIVSGIIWEYIAKPIIGLLGSFSGTFSSAFSNYFYMQCARANINDTLLILFSFITLPILAIAVLFDAFGFFTVKKDIDAIKQLDEEAKKLSNGTIDGKNTVTSKKS